MIGRRTTRTRRRVRDWRRLILSVAGLTLIGAGVVELLRVPWFYLRSAWVGGHLVQRTEHALRSRQAGAVAWPAGVVALLRIPALGLTAPVLQGTNDAVLNVGVGHLRTSVLPGFPGTSVLAAHDVTWFRHLDRLKPGDAVVVKTRHRTWTFRVTRAAVVRTGTPVYNTPTPSIVLESCYPLDALYLTPYRYLVWADLTHTAGTGQTLALPPAFQYQPVGIPAAFPASALTLATNYLPMGKLHTIGRPSTRWVQSNGPLNAEAATLALYFAALKTAGADRPAWWHQLAPRVPWAALAPLVTGHIVKYDSAANIVEVVHGSVLTQTRLTVAVTVAGRLPGVYRLSLTTAVAGSRVRVQTWTLTRL